MAVPSWSQARGDTDVLHGRGRFGSWGRAGETRELGAWSQLAPGLQHKEPGLLSSCSRGAEPPPPPTPVGPSPARCLAPALPATGHPGMEPATALAGGRGEAHILAKRGCHPVVRDGPPGTSSQTRTQHMPSPGISHLKQPQISRRGCQTREPLGGHGPSLQPGAAQSLMKHTPSPDPYLEINKPVNPSLWDHHEDDICQSPCKESQELEQDL